MSRRDPADLSSDDLLQRLGASCSITALQLADPEHFPSPDYHDETGVSFWRAETVRAWVQAYAEAEVLTLPGELERLTALVQLTRKFRGAEPFPAADAKEQALRYWADARVKTVLGIRRIVAGGGKASS